MTPLRNFPKGIEIEHTWKQLAYSRPTVYSKRPKARTTMQLKSRAEELQALLLAPTISQNVLYQKILRNRLQPTQYRE